MAEAGDRNERETPPSEAPKPKPADSTLSRWERQKLDVYREEHPDAEPWAEQVEATSRDADA